MDLDLKGKTALVTGGSRGIGLSTVRALVAEGARVVTCARTPSPELRAVDATFVAADLATPGGVRAAVDTALGTLGDLDILVNNAGGGDPATQAGPFADLTDTAWDEAFDLNFRAAQRAIKHALPSLLRRRGTIVNVASVGAVRPGADLHAYNAAKAALITLSRGLAEELGPKGVRVTTVSPGPTLTRAYQSRAARRAEQSGASQGTALAEAARAGRMTLGRLVDPDEVAVQIVLAASPKGHGLLGANIRVDGGSTKSV
ncbi:MAG TPA: SDR family NAD(P)-dependent oxidoreductase [Amycolatopsis sp.]|nr:SDR family NAD(P)-dependent oxidoreductase [Amycolatopsis sp.]